MIRAKYDWIINEKKPDDGFFKLAKKKSLRQDIWAYYWYRSTWQDHYW